MADQPTPTTAPTSPTPTTGPTESTPTASSAPTDTAKAPPAPDAGAGGTAVAADVVATESKPASDVPAVTERPLAPQAKPTAGGFYWGTGRRKSAVARVRIRPGDGKYLINNREIDNFFAELRDRHCVVAPLKITKTEGKLDVFVNVKGGGFMGQAGAVLLGLSRALKGYDPTLEVVLRQTDFLSRDPREVERKKYGQPGARKKFQFSKR